MGGCTWDYIRNYRKHECFLFAFSVCRTMVNELFIIHAWEINSSLTNDIKQNKKQTRIAANHAPAWRQTCKLASGSYYANAAV